LNQDEFILISGGIILIGYEETYIECVNNKNIDSNIIIIPANKGGSSLLFYYKLTYQYVEEKFIKIIDYLKKIVDADFNGFLKYGNDSINERRVKGKIKFDL
jgi:hypothetical protein